MSTPATDPSSQRRAGSSRLTYQAANRSSSSRNHQTEWATSGRTSLRTPGPFQVPCFNDVPAVIHSRNGIVRMPRPSPETWLTTGEWRAIQISSPCSSSLTTRPARTQPIRPCRTLRCMITRPVSNVMDPLPHSRSIPAGPGRLRQRPLWIRPEVAPGAVERERPRLNHRYHGPRPGPHVFAVGHPVVVGKGEALLELVVVLEGPLPVRPHPDVQVLVGQVNPGRAPGGAVVPADRRLLEVDIPGGEPAVRRPQPPHRVGRAARVELEDRR